MNIYDVSRQAGVSIATVSRVINNNTNVSEKTRAKVLSVIEENGYTPNAFARGLGLNTMKTIGILCPDCSDAYIAQAVYHIEQGLRKNGYDCLLCCTGFEKKVKAKSMELLISKRVDSIVMVGSFYTEDDDAENEYIRLASKNIPIMLMNGKLAAPNIYCTLCDDSAGVYDVTSLFIESGHTRILYIYDTLSFSSSNKLDGYRKAIKDAGITEENTLFIKQSSGEKIDDVVRALSEYKDFEKKFDGIIASDDIIAIGALKYAKKCGISVPDQLFVSGYNNSEFGRCSEPEVTTVDNKLEAICHQCVTTLMGVFAGNSMPKMTVFSADVVPRATTDFKERT